MTALTITCISALVSLASEIIGYMRDSRQRLQASIRRRRDSRRLQKDDADPGHDHRGCSDSLRDANGEDEAGARKVEASAD